MKKILAAALGAALLIGAQSASAGTIQVALQSPGTNGGNITVEGFLTNNSGFLFWPIPVSYGGFNTSGNAVDTAGLGLPTILSSNSIDVSTQNGGDLTIIIASSNLNAPLGNGTSWLTSFTNNSVQNNIAVTMSAYLDLTNAQLVDNAPGLPGTAVLLASATIGGVGIAGPFYNTTNISGPFSVFEVYHVMAGAGNSFNLSINEIATVPTPAPLALLGLGLAALAGVTRFRKSGARA